MITGYTEETGSSWMQTEKVRPQVYKSNHVENVRDSSLDINKQTNLENTVGKKITW